MRNLIAKGVAWNARQQHRFASTPVAYRRDGRTVLLQAVKGQSDFGSDATRGVDVEMTTTDWLVTVQDLFTAGFGEPQRGDEIDERTQGLVLTYVVSTPEGQQPWRYSDPSRVRVRIHSRISNRASD